MTLQLSEQCGYTRGGGSEADRKKKTLPERLAERMAEQNKPKQGERERNGVQADDMKLLWHWMI